MANTCKKFLPEYNRIKKCHSRFGGDTSLYFGRTRLNQPTVRSLDSILSRGERGLGTGPNRTKTDRTDTENE